MKTQLAVRPVLAESGFIPDIRNQKHLGPQIDMRADSERALWSMLDDRLNALDRLVGKELENFDVTEMNL